MARVMTYPAESYAGGREADKTSIPGMGLMDGIGVFVAELF